MALLGSSLDNSANLDVRGILNQCVRAGEPLLQEGTWHYSSFFICCQPPAPGADQLQVLPVHRAKPHRLNAVNESDLGEKKITVTDNPDPT